jgi:putative transposase
VTIKPPYHDLPSAYFVHVHLLFQTWYNRPVLGPAEQSTICDTVSEVCECRNYHLLAECIQQNRVEVLLSLRPQQSVTQVVTTLKSNLSRRLFLEHPQLEAQMGGRRMWAGSYKAETTGVVSTAQVKAYIDDQRHHHQVKLQAPHKFARYVAPDKASYQQFQHHGRSVYRLHYHFVLTTTDCLPVIDEAVAEYLARTFLRIGDAKCFMMLSFDILDSHVHLLIAARPTDAPQVIAEALMNNSSVMTLRRFETLKAHFSDDQLWIPGFFVRSLGRSTARVKAALQSARSTRKPTPSGVGT